MEKKRKTTMNNNYKPKEKKKGGNIMIKSETTKVEHSQRAKNIEVTISSDEINNAISLW